MESWNQCEDMFNQFLSFALKVKMFHKAFFDGLKVLQKRLYNRLLIPPLKIDGLIVLGVVLCFSVVGCSFLLTAPIAPTSVHLTLGNPSNAGSTPNNYLMVKPQYALSYNNSTRIPNWVSWQLNASWLGPVQRLNDFRPDPSLPMGWYRVLPSDYNGSGFDRGHVAPSGDRTNTLENNSATFLMTNILPQSADNNRGPWEKLESYCRELVMAGKELYIVAGGYGRKRTIAKGKIVAPAHTWKVVVVLDQPGQGVQGITAETRVIAVAVPNIRGIKETPWRTFRVSVTDLEAATGYNFLSNVPEAVQKAIEGKVDEG